MVKCEGKRLLRQNTYSPISYLYRVYNKFLVKVFTVVVFFFFKVKPKEISLRDQILWTQSKLEEQKKLGLKYTKQMEKIPDEFTPR